MAKEKFKGLPYPIVFDPRGLTRYVTEVDTVKGDLLCLLMTNPGERVMNPDYGTGLRRLIYEPNDVGLKDQARSLIIQAISKWEPRVTIEQIEVYTGEESPGDLSQDDDGSNAANVLIIKILFFLKNDITSIQELRLDVPLQSNI